MADGESSFGMSPCPSSSCLTGFRRSRRWSQVSRSWSESEREARVLVINTGGTIGMVYEDNVLTTEPHTFVGHLKKLPMLHDQAYAERTQLFTFHKDAGSTLVLPLWRQDKRVVYTVLEYDPLLDSCNMTTDDWAKIAEDIKKHYEDYDGFVVLHGTDTMAYTASALSFMCEHQGKPIILTGSQVPISEMRSDGRDNLLGALLIAGHFVIPEVGLYFHHKLYRGNRVTKVDSGRFKAFLSPNLPPLINAEVNITVSWDMVWRPNTMHKFRVHTNLNRNVGLLRLFPGITSHTIRAFLQPPMQAIVLETYGTGNAPDKRPDLLEELRAATDRGVLIINCTQCLCGSVSESYATGKALLHCGVIPGGDMTPEAALAKLSYVLGKSELSIKQQKEILHENLRGEMTTVDSASKFSLRDSSFLCLVANAIGANRTEELESVRDALVPVLACAAAKTGDLETLQRLQHMGANLSGDDYDNRTPLHVAACEGHLETVTYLLGQGATVHTHDRYGSSPLRNAAAFRQFPVIKLLRQTGAHLSREECDNLGSELCSMAANGDMEGLEAWALAGVDLEAQIGYNGQNPLEVAKEAGRSDVLEFLKKLQSQSKTWIDGHTEMNGFDVPAIVGIRKN
uniref:60 kDa lysophospholipase isoform X2 n=1 Tax=Myxine glutinosa TaxID=7769 RepID=UPI00358FFA8F